MPSKAQAALSANMAALSYALEQAGMTDRAPLEVKVASGTGPGVRQRRRESQESAPASDMSLEFEPGKPLKNFGRMLAHSADIPLPYNMRQSAEAAEAARVDYENQNDTFGAMGDTFLAQMQENSLAGADEVESRIYDQYAAQGLDAMNSFFEEGASAEQRQAAYAKLSQLDQEARGVRNADSNERAKFARNFLGGELATSRAGLVSLDMAEKDRVMSFESELAQLDSTPRGSVEEQAMLRAMLQIGVQRSQDGLATLLKAGGGAIQMAGDPRAVAVGAVAQVAGSLLQNEQSKLERDTVLKMRLEMNDAMDAMTNQFRPEIVRLHQGVVDQATSYGIPDTGSWSKDRITLDTPYADAVRGRLFEGGGSGVPVVPRGFSQGDKGLDVDPSAPMADPRNVNPRAEAMRRPTR